ncbi:MAG: class I SAM-dependent methyltransferase [Bdellovibrionota bacterium]
MLPIHRTQNSVFNYTDIPAGYYYEVMLNGHAVQRFWHREKFMEVAKLVKNAGAKTVLDFGCGPGSFLAVLGETVPGVQAIGVDIASPQIDFAGKNIASKFPGNIKFQLLNGEKLPYADASFDAVTCIEVIEHIHPFLAAKILAEARRVLKPDGIFVLTTPNYRSFWPMIEWLLERASPVKYHDQHISKFTPNSLVKFLETCGFEISGINSIFVTAPFLNPFSKALAQVVHRFEVKLRPLIGSLLIVQAKPFHEV